MSTNACTSIVVNAHGLPSLYLHMAMSDVRGLTDAETHSLSISSSTHSSVIQRLQPHRRKEKSATYTLYIFRNVVC